jgi:hypothetical protein
MFLYPACPHVLSAHSQNNATGPRRSPTSPQYTFQSLSSVRGPTNHYHEHRQVVYETPSFTVDENGNYSDPSMEPGSSSESDSDEEELPQSVSSDEPSGLNVKPPPRRPGLTRSNAMVVPADELASSGKRKREDVPQDIEISSCSIKPCGAAYGDSYGMTDASFSQDNAEDEDPFGDPMDVDQETSEVLSPLTGISLTASLQLRRKPQRKPRSDSYGSVPSPLRPKDSFTFSGYRCTMEGCTFKASSLQHLQHHSETFQHGRHQLF